MIMFKRADAQILKEELRHTVLENELRELERGMTASTGAMVFVRTSQYFERELKRAADFFEVPYLIQDTVSL